MTARAFFIFKGDPYPQSATRRIGSISGTKGNDNCPCIPNSQNTSGEVCPSRSKRQIYNGRRQGTRNRNRNRNDGTFCNDYDDNDYFDSLSGIDRGLQEQESVTVVTNGADTYVELTTPR